MDGGNYGDTANSISMLIADTTVFKGNMEKAAIFSTKYKHSSHRLLKPLSLTYFFKQNVVHQSS